MALPEIKDRLDKLGAEPFVMSSDAFQAFLVKETARAADVVKRAGVKAQ